VRYPDPNSVPHAQVVGVYGAFHLGQLQVGLSRAVRLAQCRAARITLRGPLPVQVDGEPWLQPPAVLTVSHTGQARRPLTRCARHADTICFLSAVRRPLCSLYRAPAMASPCPSVHAAAAPITAGGF